MAQPTFKETTAQSNAGSGPALQITTKAKGRHGGPTRVDRKDRGLASKDTGQPIVPLPQAAFERDSYTATAFAEVLNHATYTVVAARKSGMDDYRRLGVMEALDAVQSIVTDKKVMVSAICCCVFPRLERVPDGFLG